MKSFPASWLGRTRTTAVALLLTLTTWPVAALERTNTVFKVFQFPADQIPRIDGDTNDWSIVPESYVIGMDQLTDDSGKHQRSDASAPNIHVKVGWVKGLNRLYFFTRPTTIIGTLRCPACTMTRSNWWWMPTCPAGR